MKTINLVIPMKAPAESKQRLKSALGRDQRFKLAISLFEQTLAFFHQHFNHLPILVVTSSDLIANLARRYEANVLLEEQSDGLNLALEKATQWSIEQGFASQLILPADIACLKVEEIEKLLHFEMGKQGVAIAVAKDKGTNALLCSPPDAIPFCFGFESSKAHQIEALNKSLDCHLLDLPFLGQDVDLPVDLAYLKAPLDALNRINLISKNTLIGGQYANLNG
ncbi:2-phospho-L-lactate guanylyltransferase [Marinomonas sp. S3726]|jgi:2-phospho-L-lactate guanylyltransferase|uniref:2-phospho-L-lactate guanylyltransferase n=1 Tax=Marinomonas sp. S3726 TaxID=579484 RepID=UPI000696458E|nr:2-phospho-L-lactate guanylyltransferase [Marinomonas sp. S3726]